MARDPQIIAVIGELNGFTERIVKKVTLDVTANLQAPPSDGGTPVDTGWARANWIPSIGIPIQEDLSGITPDPAVVPGAAAKSVAGQAEVATQYKLSLGPVFVSNNVPYIPILNQGSSQQAPAAFVQQAIAKAVFVDLKGFK